MTLTEMADLHIPEALSNGVVPLDGLVVPFRALMTAKYGQVVSDAARLAANAIAGKRSDAMNGRRRGWTEDFTGTQPELSGAWYDDEWRMVTYWLGNLPVKIAASLFAQSLSNAVRVGADAFRRSRAGRIAPRRVTHCAGKLATTQTTAGRRIRY